MKQIAMVSAVIILLSGCAAAPPEAILGGSAASREELAGISALDTRSQATIKMFASLAANSDIEGLMNLVAPTAKAANGDQAVRNNMTEKIIPFFADFENLVGPAGLGPASFPDGRKGSAYYIYIKTKAGIRRPFFISLLDEEGRSLIADIGVNICFPRRHPVCVFTDGSDVLKRDVTTAVMQWDSAKDKECTLRNVVSTEIVGIFDEAASQHLDLVQRETRKLGESGAPTGVERWTVNRCGKLVVYRVTLVPGTRGGTHFSVQPE